MRVELCVDKDCLETKIVVVAQEHTSAVDSLVAHLSFGFEKCILGYVGNTESFLKPSEILRIFSSNGKVFASTDSCIYVLRQRLYVLEDVLQPYYFIRISYSEIINLGKVKKFDLSLSGTILVIFEDDSVSFVSRRYVKELKKRICL